MGPAMKTHHQYISLNTQNGIHISDITPQVNEIINTSGISLGMLTLSSMHTTLAVTVNEAEERLLIDIDVYFSKLVPAEATYLHNDLHLRDVPPDEPENAHAHLIAMMLGNSESLAIVDSKAVLGTYQSIMTVELDGPRQRQLSLQIMGI